MYQPDNVLILVPRPHQKLRGATVFPRETRPVEFGGLTEKFPKSVEFPGGSSFPENDTDSEIGERSSFWHFIFRKISKIYLKD